MERSSALPPSPFLVHGAMLLTAFLVSTSFTVGKAITPYLDPVILTLIRFLIASTLFWLLLRRHAALSLPTPLALFRYSLISAALVGFFWLMFLALRHTSPLNTAVIFTTVPGLSGLYSWFLVRERLKANQLIALFLAMAGAIWVICDGKLTRLWQLHFNSGDLLFFAACLFMAAYTPLVKKFHCGESMRVMTFWILITGSCWLFLLAIPKLEIFSHLQDVPIRVWIGISYLAIFTTITTFFLTQWATLYLGPTRVAAYSFTYPIYIVVIEWALRGTLPSFATVLGVMLFFFPAMYVLQKSLVPESKKTGK